MLNQISLFAANTKGALSKMTAVLAESDINIYTMLATDSAEFGIIRLIVDKPEPAKKVLEEAGYQCRLDKVIAIDMASDKPGTLNRILTDLRNANVMIRYLYISFDRNDSTPIAVFSTNEPETETFLKGKGYRLLDRF
ncbi:MAG: amino acid-binding protein [Acidaminococcaceae bacterium]|nr:amino acid-binding protein [Acidaminococcaceae bacterium]